MDGEVSRASNRGPTRSTHHTEMAEGGSVGRRRVDGDEGGNTARSSDIAAVGEYLPALRLRSLGEKVAGEVGAWGYGGCPLCRRCRTGVRAQERRGSVSGAVAGADAEIRAGTTCREDAV